MNTIPETHPENKFEPKTQPLPDRPDDHLAAAIAARCAISLFYAKVIIALGGFGSGEAAR